MNRNEKIKNLSMNAMIAAVYVAMTFMIQPLAYREIQFRLSEVIVLLAFYNKKLIPGLIVGCMIANIPSPLGIIDVVIGTFSTVCVCYAMNKSNNIYIAALLGSIITGMIIGIELSLVYSIPFVINALYVFIGEVVVLFIGTFVFKRLEKNIKFMEYIRY